MTKKAKALSKAGRRPRDASLPMSVSSPIAANATDSREVVATTIHALASGGIATRLLTPTMATNPSTNHGSGGPPDGLPASDVRRFVPRAAIQPIAMTIGASSITRDNFAIVPRSEEHTSELQSP